MSQATTSPQPPLIPEYTRADYDPPERDSTFTIRVSDATTSATAVPWWLDARTPLERTLDELLAATRALAAALTDLAEAQA